MTNDSHRTYRLVVSCPDRVGIVARVSQLIADLGGWLTESNYHADAQANWLFMRNEIRADSLDIGLDQFRAAFAEMADEFEMAWFIRDSAALQRVVLLASRTSHCVADLLH